MARMHRIYIQNNPIFITNVTYLRQTLLDGNSELLRNSFNSAKLKLPHEIIAWVILPEHFHLLVNPLEGNISSIMKTIKLSFASNYRKCTNLLSGRVWQNGFYDHIIRNEKDFNRHLNYIHYNPVKHGLVKNAWDYEFSSLMQFKDFYSQDWGILEEDTEGTDFGE
jgi:putative transposase